MNLLTKLFGSAVVIVAFVFSGCASNTGYNKGLADSSAVKGSSRSIAIIPDAALRSAKLTLVAKGFSIDSIDSQNGLIKSSRNLPDEKDKDLSYRINATVDVTPDESGSVVTLAANQQTVLHRTVHTWWHLLWILPLFPTSTEYQTSVLKEGDITDTAFYNDFFVALGKTVGPEKTAAVSPSSDAAPEPTAAPQ